MRRLFLKGVSYKFRESVGSLKLVVRQTQLDHILVNYSIAPGLYWHKQSNFAKLVTSTSNLLSSSKLQFIASENFYGVTTCCM